MEEKRMIDADELIEELGFAKECEHCKQNKRECQYNYFYSIMDFCNMIDIAIETILERHKNK